MIRKLALWVAEVAAYTAILFGVAGRWDLPLLWAYLAIGAAGGLALILTIDPDLAKERLRPGPGGIDRWRRIPFGVLFLTHLVVGLLDAGRFHWSDTVPLGLRVAGLAAYAAALAWLVWAVAVNRFFSAVVRIQAERGHRLITAGPYRYVRHPGYLGMTLLLSASALALGSWWALVPAVVNAVLIFRRLVIEERYLRDHLDGYTAYTGRVPYRLVPGVW